MTILLTIVHVLIAILLILAVLLQAGKGGGLAASLGGGLSSSSILGGRAASTFLSKATSILASAFLISCLILSFAYDVKEEAPTTAIERTLGQGASVTPAPFTMPEGQAATEEAPSELGGAPTQSADEGATDAGAQ